MPVWLMEWMTWFGGLSEFWSAIAGAIIGGFFATLLQLIATASARKERMAERKEILRTLGYGSLWKVIAIHSDFHNISQHIEDSHRRVPEDHHQSPSQFVVPLASYPEQLTFTTEEMALVVSLKSDTLLNDMMVIGQNHRTVIDSLKAYDRLRTEIGELLQPTSTEGAKAIIEDAAQLQRHGHRIAAADDLIREIRHLSTMYEGLAKATLELLHKRLKDTLGVGGDLQFLFNAGPATIGQPV